MSWVETEGDAGTPELASRLRTTVSSYCLFNLTLLQPTGSDRCAVTLPFSLRHPSCTLLEYRFEDLVS